MSRSLTTTFRRAGALALALALTSPLGACGDAGADADWSAKPLEPVTVDVKGQPITVSLPAGMEREARSPFVRYQPAGDAKLGLPTFTFAIESVGAPRGPDDLKLESGTAQKPMTVVKREAVAGGLLITGHNSTRGTVEVRFFLGREGGGAVSCRGVQARSEGVPSPEATLAMLERACTSMKLK